jgi:Fe2+ transport system protein FeoA
MIISLNQMRPGQSAQVVELKSKDASRLDKLSAFGILPGSQLLLSQLQPVLIFSVGETEISVDHEVGSQIMVDSLE